MPRAARRTMDRRALVDRYVTDLTSVIKDRCPDAELEISFTRYEDEDAHILVFPPDDFKEADRDRLSAKVAERSVNILLKTGVLILAGVYEPSQRPGRRHGPRPSTARRPARARSRR